MKRLTTNFPDSNLDAALNLFYIKDFETWVRGGGDGPDYPDIRLYDFIRKAAKILLPDLDFPMDDDGVDYAMGEFCWTALMSQQACLPCFIPQHGHTQNCVAGSCNTRTRARHRWKCPHWLKIGTTFALSSESAVALAE